MAVVVSPVAVLHLPIASEMVVLVVDASARKKAGLQSPQSRVDSMQYDVLPKTLHDKVRRRKSHNVDREHSECGFQLQALA